MRPLIVLLLLSFGCADPAPPAPLPAPPSAQPVQPPPVAAPPVAECLPPRPVVVSAAVAPAAAGRTLTAKAELRSAVEQFGKASAADPASPHGAAGQVAVLLARGQIKAARRALDVADKAGLAIHEVAPYLTAALKGWTPPVGSRDYEITADDNALAKKLQEGKYDEVLAALRALKERTPFHMKLMGDAFYNQQQWDRAVAAYRRALAAEPDNGPVAQYLADSLLRLRRFDEAITFYTALVEANPGKIGFYRLIGDAARAKGDAEVALAAYLKAQNAGYVERDLQPAIDELKREVAARGAKEEKASGRSPRNRKRRSAPKGGAGVVQ